MFKKNIFSKFILKLFLSIKEKQIKELDNPQKVLIILQHYSSGLVLTQIPLLRAIKEKYPNIKITVILNSQNYFFLYKNFLIDNYFIFDKSKLLTLKYFGTLKNELRKKYDVAIVPSQISIPLTSLMLMRIANAAIRIGAKSLSGEVNEFNFLFDSRVELDWAKTPDAHISDFTLDIVRPFGIDSKNYSITINNTEKGKNDVKEFLKKFNGKNIIGININAEENQNKWPLKNFAALIEKLNSKYSCSFFIIGNNIDKEEYNFLESKLSFKIEKYNYNSINELVDIFNNSNLLITNNSNVMFIAGATTVPQISIFGNVNPFNYAPIGENKYFIRKSDLINDVNVDDVYEQCKLVLDKQK